MADDDYERELERRLRIIEDPAYEDSARRDLPRVDVVVLLVLGALLVIAMWIWGAPA